MNPNNNNGRISVLNDKNYDMYKLFNEQKPKYNDFNREAIMGMHNTNDLSEIFFSNKNLDIVQDAIRRLVYEKSCKKHLIDRQSDTELRIIMRSIYIQEGRHSQHDVIAEVKRLNTLVLDYAVPKIIQEISMYVTRYKQDIDKMPEPMSRGEFVSSKGTKVLIQKEF